MGSGKHDSVAAIVLNWNNYADTANCLNSLDGIVYSEIDRFVVDNGSTDQSKDQIEAEFPSVTMVSSDSNRGFAGGMNLGIQEAIEDGYDYVWLLNNDTEFPQEGVLGTLTDALAENSSIGMVTPVILEDQDTGKRWFTQGEIDWETATASHANPPIESSTQLIENQYIPLCSAMIDTGVFSDVGLLPEEYFLYYEDLDFGVTLRKNGYEIMTCASTSVVHEQGGTAGGQFDPLFSYYQPRNLLLFARKYQEQLPSKFPLSLSLWTAEQIAYRIINGHSVSPFLQGIYDGSMGRSGKGRYPSE